MSSRSSRSALGRHARYGAVLGAVVVLIALTSIGLAGRAAAAPEPAVSIDPTVGDVIDVRPDRVDLMINGGVVSSVRYGGGQLTAANLAALVARPSWLQLTGSTLVLRAGLFQSPGSNLMFASPAVNRVLLVGDASRVGGTVRGTSATTTFVGVTVLGWDDATQQPASESSQRPYIYYRHGSSVRATSSTFDHLGRAELNAEGVTLAGETTGAVSRATFSNSRTGLSLLGAGAVTVSSSAMRANSVDGLRVKAGRSVVLHDLTSSGNAGYGVRVDQARGTRLDGIRTAHNAAAGIDLVGSSGITLSGESSDTDRIGLHVADGCTHVVLTSAHFLNDRTGVMTDGGASEVSLRGITASSSSLNALDLAGVDVEVSGAVIAGAPTGISLTRTSESVRVSNSRITDVATGVDARPAAKHIVLTAITLRHVRGDGVRSGSSGIVLQGLRIASAGTGVRIYGHARGTALTGSTITSSAVGVAASRGVSGLRASDVAMSGTSTGIASSALSLQTTRVTITKAAIAMRLSGQASITDGTVSDVNEAVRVGSGAVVKVSAIHLSASGVALVVAKGGRLRVDGSVIAAGTLSVGHVSFGSHNSLPPEKLRWYGLAAVAAAVSACLLELVRRLREKREDLTWQLPAAVLDTR